MNRILFLSLVLGGALAGMSSLAAAETDIDYGAGKVNAMGTTQGTKLGGRDDFNCLALADHPGPSGVPVGGIGVGCFDYAPTGAFTRVAINNWHSEGGASYTVEQPPGSFLALWRDGKAQLLARGNEYAGMAPATHTTYRGLFPIAENKIDDAATVRVWSGLVPHDVKDSSLPLAWIEVDVANSGAAEQKVSVALSWQDVLTRGVRDLASLDILKGAKPNVWGREKAVKDATAKKIPAWQNLARVKTRAGELEVGNFSGLCQSSEPLQPLYKTFQNYNNEVALLAESSPDAAITLLPSYAVDTPDDAWKSFRETGQFPAGVAGNLGLYDPAQKKEAASAVAVTVKLKPGEKRTIRFLVSWFQPELKIDPAKDDPNSYFGAASHGRFYHNSFASLSGLIAYAAQNRDRIWQGTKAWQDLVLASSYPDWLKFKVINSAYTMYTNTILDKGGDFTVMEGGMGGLAGTMDQRLAAHPFYEKFFPELNRTELEMFGNHAGAKGQITHFIGHYYWGVASKEGETPVPDSALLDNTGSWLTQIAKVYQQTGDKEWISQFQPQVERSLAYAKNAIKSKTFQIPTGPTTYDDFWHPEIYAYNSTTYPAFLNAGAVLWTAFGDPARAQACRDQEKLSADDAVKALWNGKYFAYGCDLDGGNRRDDIMFSGQLAGQFVSRFCTWGDIFPMDKVRSSLVAQMRTNVLNSPDYYAPKVWLIQENHAMLDPKRPNEKNTDSTCWPFYLESYTAMPAIQAGYVEDGLSILRHIQLVHLRNGWEWTQNLWRPGELTYVAAPVSWFITDILACAGLDLPDRTLYLSPVMTKSQETVKLPLFYPRFWATVTADRAAHTLTLHIDKLFPGADMTLDRVIAQPVGIPTGEQKAVTIPAFKIAEGATLDLSAHWNDLVGGDFPAPVLPHDDKLGL